MAATHIRSNSFPSRSHPLSSTVEEQLQRLRSSSEATSSSSSVCQKLGGLKDLYDSADDWLQLSLTQQSLSHPSNRQCVEELLDRSLQTLDVCGTIQQVLSLMKDSLRELASSLRRKTASSNELSAYMASRKHMKKVIYRTMESLKKMEKRRNIVNREEQEASLSFLREVEMISRSVFESLLSFLSKPKATSRGWSLISNKLVSPKITSSEDIAGASELECLDSDLLRMKAGKDKNNLMHDVQNLVEALESSVQEIEEVSESILRCLVKTRVSLLNCLNH